MLAFELRQTTGVEPVQVEAWVPSFCYYTCMWLTKMDFDHDALTFSWSQPMIRVRFIDLMLDMYAKFDDFNIVVHKVDMLWSNATLTTAS